MLINCEPQSYEEAQELKEWNTACEKEIASIVKNGMWKLVDLPHRVKPSA